MTSPLIKKIGGILKQALPAAGITEAATLTRSTPGTRTTGAQSAGTNPTTTAYACKGFVASETFAKIGGTLVEKNDRVICLVGLTAIRPGSGDTVTIDSKTQPVVDSEGSLALWKLLCRGPIT